MQPAFVVFCERNASLVRSPVRPCAFHVKIKSCALFYSRGRELGNTTQSRPQIRSLPDSVSHEEDWECAILEIFYAGMILTCMDYNKSSTQSRWKGFTEEED
ncbi:hypothetical protein QQP08_005896 [Theobroma cacao]|nr:hypothetical protein QQP08_005896 [Theobroma cacao]